MSSSVMGDLLSEFTLVGLDYPKVNLVKLPDKKEEIVNSLVNQESIISTPHNSTENIEQRHAVDEPVLQVDSKEELIANILTNIYDRMGTVEKTFIEASNELKQLRLAIQFFTSHSDDENEQEIEDDGDIEDDTHKNDSEESSQYESNITPSELDSDMDATVRGSIILNNIGNPFYEEINDIDIEEVLYHENI